MNSRVPYLDDECLPKETPPHVLDRLRDTVEKIHDCINWRPQTLKKMRKVNRRQCQKMQNQGPFRKNKTREMFLLKGPPEEEEARVHRNKTEAELRSEAESKQHVHTHTHTGRKTHIAMYVTEPKCLSGMHANLRVLVTYKRGASATTLLQLSF